MDITYKIQFSMYLVVMVSVYCIPNYTRVDCTRCQKLQTGQFFWNTMHYYHLKRLLYVKEQNKNSNNINYNENKIISNNTTKICKKCIIFLV